MNSENEIDYMEKIYSLNITNFIKVLQPDSTNIYLYPAILRISYAVEKNHGYVYDAFNAEMYRVMAVVEYNDSIAAWLYKGKFNLRLINVIGGVPILGKAISTNVDNNPNNIKESMEKYNKENNNDIHSYFPIQLA